jgi:hypothetical protein
MMENKSAVKIIRNAIIIGAVITFIGIMFHFFSGNYIGNRLEGTWRAVCIHDEITFAGDGFIHGRDAGDFRVRANSIYFCIDCAGYPIRITERYMILNGIYYFRVER